MLISFMDGSLVWSTQYHQSGTSMPLGAVHPIIARSEATKQSSLLVETKLDCFASLAMTVEMLIYRDICLVRDLGPARGLPAHHVAELLWSHGFGFRALIGEKRSEFGRGQHLVDLRVERIDDIFR